MPDERDPFRKIPIPDSPEEIWPEDLSEDLETPITQEPPENPAPLELSSKQLDTRSEAEKEADRQRQLDSDFAEVRRRQGLEKDLKEANERIRKNIEDSKPK